MQAFRSADAVVVNSEPNIFVLDFDTIAPQQFIGLRNQFSSARFVAIGRPGDEAVLNAFAHGLHGWVASWEPAQTIESAVAVTARGACSLSFPILQILLQGRRPSKPQTAAGLALAVERGLSTREIEVLQLAARGMSDLKIAAVLTLSVRTVNRHVSNILKKLGCKSRHQATKVIFGVPPPSVLASQDTLPHPVDEAS